MPLGARHGGGEGQLDAVVEVTKPEEVVELLRDVKLQKARLERVSSRAAWGLLAWGSRPVCRTCRRPSRRN